MYYPIICLFGVLRRFQHCTGHILQWTNNGMGLLLPHIYHNYPNCPHILIYEIINDHPTTGESSPSCPLLQCLLLDCRSVSLSHLLT